MLLRCRQLPLRKGLMTGLSGIWLVRIADGGHSGAGQPGPKSLLAGLKVHKVIDGELAARTSLDLKFACDAESKVARRRLLTRVRTVLWTSSVENEQTPN